MQARELRSIILGLPQFQPLTTALLSESIPSGWSDEQTHLVNWLGDYDGPGYYGRSGRGYDARHFYQHFQDGYGLLWLAEAVGVSRSILEQGASAIRNTHGRPGSKAAAFRRVCPWSVVEARLQTLATAKHAPTFPIQGQNTGRVADRFLEALNDE